MVAAAVSSGSTPPRDDLGTKKDNLSKIDPSRFGIDLKDLSPETFDKIKAIIDSANSLLTEDERKYNEENKRRQVEVKKKFDEALEQETRKEIFEIPKGSTKTYHFIGYDSDQYIELMSLGNKADDLNSSVTEEEDITKRGEMRDEYNRLTLEVFKKTIKYSLEGMTDEILTKLPKRQLHWLYLIMKDKNDNPLPFEVNV